MDAMRLKLESDLVTPSSENYKLKNWPPADDFPMSIDASGNVVSRFSDSILDLTPYGKKVVRINFGDGALSKGTAPIDAANARLFRCVVAWWLYGHGGLLNPQTVRARAFGIRPLFVACSESGILASDLHKFPLVAENFFERVKGGSRPERLVSMFHDLWGARDEIGFTLLDDVGVRQLAIATPRSKAEQQTPYIPRRIWLYQLGRIRQALEDFQENAKGIEGLFRFCLELYTAAYGSLEAALLVSNKKVLSPFSHKRKWPLAHTPRETFAGAAERFGVARLLERWCLPPGRTLRDDKRGVFRLSSYFSMISTVGTAYLANLSGARIQEAMSLRLDCLQVEIDEQVGEIHLLCGETTKTNPDDDARWVTSRSAAIAVEAMSLISRLRMICAAAHPDVPIEPGHLSNPWLCPRAYEPWGRIKSREARLPLSVRQNPPEPGDWPARYPNLFDPAELEITEADLEEARLITPSLDPIRYSVGMQWPLAYHQLRRTVAVNMLGSGVVGDASLQVQLKHEARAQSLYYGHGYSRLKLNKSYREEYVRTAYEMVALQASQLITDRYVSPFGSSHKANMLRAIDPSDRGRLAKLAKQGEVSLRETLLGLCMKRGPCAYGGIENVIHCPSCSDALIDKKRLPTVVDMMNLIDIRLVDAPPDSPLHQSLTAQKSALEVAIDVISDDR